VVDGQLVSEVYNQQQEYEKQWVLEKLVGTNTPIRALPVAYLRINDREKHWLL
jgi:hypothetical protein